MMPKLLTGWWHAFTGAGDHSITVPPMDGPLHPNTRLEEASRLAEVELPDNLCVHAGQILFTSGETLLRLPPDGGPASEIARHAAPVTALASDGRRLAVALADGRIVVRDGDAAAPELRLPAAAGAACITAMLFDGDRLLVANGSAQNRMADWKRDLMEKRVSGSLWRLGPDGGAERLAAGLAFPYGLVRRGDGTIICSESWRHRLVAIGERGALRPLVSDLPAYPSRLTPSRKGGYWLTAFAPRTQMVEFMLREKRARLEMIATIEPDYWMAPRHASGRSFREPLQGGGIKQLGILKPWAPTQSYGLVIRLDEAMQPVESFHSRADGTIHGVTSCVEFGLRLYAASKGANCVVALDPPFLMEAAI